MIAVISCVVFLVGSLPGVWGSRRFTVKNCTECVVRDARVKRAEIIIAYCSEVAQQCTCHNHYRLPKDSAERICRHELRGLQYPQVVNYVYIVPLFTFLFVFALLLQCKKVRANLKRRKAQGVHGTLYDGPCVTPHTALFGNKAIIALNWALLFLSSRLVVHAFDGFDGLNYMLPTLLVQILSGTAEKALMMSAVLVAFVWYRLSTGLDEVQAGLGVSFRGGGRFYVEFTAARLNHVLLFCILSSWIFYPFLLIFGVNNQGTHKALTGFFVVGLGFFVSYFGKRFMKMLINMLQEEQPDIIPQENPMNQGPILAAQPSIRDALQNKVNAMHVMSSTQGWKLHGISKNKKISTRTRKKAELALLMGKYLIMGRIYMVLFCLYVLVFEIIIDEKTPLVICIERTSLRSINAMIVFILLRVLEGTKQSMMFPRCCRKLAKSSTAQVIKIVRLSERSFRSGGRKTEKSDHFEIQLSNIDRTISRRRNSWDHDEHGARLTVPG